MGGGPCGLRTSIEAQLQGATTYVCEKRTSYTRNNVLHLWPYVIEDLKLLGVKQFFPKFCTGSMNHISKTISNSFFYNVSYNDVNNFLVIII